MGLACIPFKLLQLFMSLMHAQILSGFTLFSFHTSGIIHVS